MQGVDKINAQTADVLMTTEIDRELNKAIEQFINLRFQKNNKFGMGFEESQKRRDDLRTLVVERDRIANFKEVVRTSTHPGGALFTDTITLPPHYRHLISITSEVMRAEDCTPFSYTLRDQDKLFYYVLNFKDFFSDGGGQYISSIQLVDDIEADPGSGNEQTVWTIDGSPFNNLLGSFPNTYFGDVVSPLFPTEQQLFIETFIDTLGLIYGNSVAAFWESWYPSSSLTAVETGFYATVESFNYPGSIVIAFDESDFPGFNFDPTAGVGASNDPLANLVAINSNNERVKFAEVRYTEDVTDHRRIPTTQDFVRERYPCRLVQHDDIFKLLDDPFNKTKYSSPLTVMRGESIDIYTDDIFIIDTIRVTYLRQPTAVNFNANTNCDLPLHTHEEIVKLAVSSILEEISDPRYQGHLTQVDRME